jgi:glycosyltransferase involved in cell wall biosynthesis
MVHSAQDQQIGYILRSYPRLSQTFVVNEILALEKLGMDLQIFPVTNPHESLVQPRSLNVRAPVRYLEPDHQAQRVGRLREHTYWARRSPGRYTSAFWYTFHSREIDSGYTASSRFQCFEHALSLARLIKDKTEPSTGRVSHLHAHFAHDPTLIAFLVHKLTGLSYSFTAHARDLFQVPVPALVQRAEHATAVITCCEANYVYLHQVLPASLQTKVHLIHHGVDLENFQTGAGNHLSAVPLILSAGRLVEKKGFSDLIQACKILQQAEIPFRCEIYGEGPLRSNLDGLIHALGLAGKVILAGARTQEQLLPIYQRAAIFALTPTITEDGDRDGIPNVLVEAMACGLPVVSTTVGGITELVQDHENGLLSQPHDIQSVADGLAELLRDEGTRLKLGTQARLVVRKEYDIQVAARQIASLFLKTLQSASNPNMA